MAPEAVALRIFIDGGYLFNVFKPYRALGYKQSYKRLVGLLSQDSRLINPDRKITDGRSRD
jgi:hypothetical protein